MCLNQAVFLSCCFFYHSKLICTLKYFSNWPPKFFFNFLKLNSVQMVLTNWTPIIYLEEVTCGDEEGRVLLLVFRTLLSQRRQSLQAQLADLWTHPEHRCQGVETMQRFVFVCLWPAALKALEKLNPIIIISRFETFSVTATFSLVAIKIIFVKMFFSIFCGNQDSLKQFSKIDCYLNKQWYKQGPWLILSHKSSARVSNGVIEPAQ